MSDVLKANRRAARGRTLLAVVLGLVTVGVIGMHLLSSGHQLAVSQETDQHHHTSASLLRGDHVPAGPGVLPHHHAARAVTPAADVGPITTLTASDGTESLVHAVRAAAISTVQHVTELGADLCSDGWTCRHDRRVLFAGLHLRRVVAAVRPTAAGWDAVARPAGGAAVRARLGGHRRCGTTGGLDSSGAVHKPDVIAR